METLKLNWWAFVIRGLAAVVFGLAAIIWPGITLAALILLFAAFALVDGVSSLVLAVRHARKQTRWWMLLIEGVVGIGAGIIAIVWPGLTALALLYLIAFWAIFTGILEIVAAVSLRREIEGEWFMAIAGIFSIAFGGLLILFPGSGALAVIWLIGAYSIAFGGVLIALGVRLRSAQVVMPSPA